MARLTPRAQHHIDQSADATKQGDTGTAAAHIRAAYALGTDDDRQILDDALAETARIHSPR